MINIIKNIIIEFQRGFNIKPLKRDLEIVYDKDINKAITIYGPRRAGKTYYLFSLINQFIREEEVTIDNIIYINFEDNRLLDLSVKELDLITNAYSELFPDSTPYYFLDEIQNIDGWSKWVRKLVDTKQKVFVTGSNSKQLSKEIATELRGRTFSHLLLPFSLLEYLRFNNFEIKNNDLYDRKKQSRFYNLFNKYLTDGGFPEISGVSEVNKDLLLNEYLNSIVFRDIVNRYNVRNIYILKFLINYILENYSCLISLNKIYNFLKSQNIKSGKIILYEYFLHLEESLFMFKSEKFSKSLKKREQYQKKYYLADTGYSKLGKSDINTGKLFENFLYLEFTRKKYTINFLSNGFECDFVLSKNKKVFAIQICYKLKSNIETFTREVNSLISAMEHLKLKTGYIITYNEKDIIKKNNNRIEIIPLNELIYNFDTIF